MNATVCGLSPLEIRRSRVVNNSGNKVGVWTVREWWAIENVHDIHKIIL